MPRSLFARLLLLLLAVLAATALLALVVARASLRNTTVKSMSRSLESAITAADLLLEHADGAVLAARLDSLDIARSATPPERSPHPLSWRRDVEAEIAARMPARTPRIVETPKPTLWIAAARPGDGWIGIPLPRLRASLLRSYALTLLGALLLIAAAAAWAARGLVRPLRRLAAAAPRIVAGESPPPPLAGAATEITDLADAFERAAGRVREAAQERELMLAGISHDMRTPLARLGIALEMIDGDAALRQGMAVDIAEIDAIVGQFIAYARNGHGETARELDAGAVLDEALAAQQRAGRDWRRLGAARATLRAKPLALRRALDNLLENAARHGKAPFEVDLRADGGAVAIVVRDRGDGVPAPQLAHLGQPFYRGDGARGGSGSGLGLAIAARLAAAHGGALVLRNREGGGFEAELLMRTAAGA